jgi:hypothetical protein
MLTKMCLGLLPMSLAVMLMSAQSSATNSKRTFERKTVYPLTRGIYVQTGTACKGAANATIREFDGYGIRDSQTHACIAHVLAHRGGRFRVMQSCIDSGSGAAPRFSEQQIVETSSRTSFAIHVRGTATSYRYCPTGF